MKVTQNNIDTVSFRELADQINDACEWLNGYGLNVPRSRIGKYRKHLSELAFYNENDKIDDLMKIRDFPTLVNSCYEANELFYIYKGLSGIKAASLKNRLKDFIKGPASSALENPSSTNRGRNIAFELHMASRLCAAGFNIDLTSDADIIVTVDGHEVIIECKRPQQDHQVNSRIKGAMSQLLKRYPTVKNPDNARGAIAISIGKILNPKMVAIDSPTATKLVEKLSSINKAFIDHYEKKWLNPEDKRCIGVIVHLGIPVVVQSENLLTNCNEFAMKTAFQNNFGYGILDNLRKAMSETNWL